MIAGFLVELAIFAVFIPVFLLLGEQPSIYTAVVASFAMTFLFAMWVGRKLESRFVLHGMLVGVAATLVYLGLSFGQPEPWQYIVAHGLKILGGAAGGRVAEKRRRTISTPQNSEAIL